MTDKHILVPVDFSKGSDRAVAQAEQLATALGARIELFHAYQLPVFALPDSTVTVSPTYVADLTERAQRELEKHRDALAARGVTATVKLLEGNAADAIVERAEALHASMIVLGTHGRSGFRRFLLGSTVERVVRMATVPVLTVHLPEE
ncbi:MAG: Universal stress protein family [Myxococcaceae bacterium]|nr:Universal stress protein family [Myxococcaceae bacterium]